MARCLPEYHGDARLCNGDKAATATLVYRLAVVPQRIH